MWIAMRGAALTILVALLPTHGHAGSCNPVVEPGAPTTATPLVFNLRANTLCPTLDDLTIDGNEITLRFSSPPDCEPLPPGVCVDNRFPIGFLAAGNYTLVAEWGTDPVVIQFTVGNVTIPAFNAYGVMFLILGLVLALLAGNRRFAGKTAD